MSMARFLLGLLIGLLPAAAASAQERVLAGPPAGGWPYPPLTAGATTGGASPTGYPLGWRSWTSCRRAPRSPRGSSTGWR